MNKSTFALSLLIVAKQPTFFFMINVVKGSVSTLPSVLALLFLQQIIFLQIRGNRIIDFLCVGGAFCKLLPLCLCNGTELLTLFR